MHRDEDKELGWFYSDRSHTPWIRAGNISSEGKDSEYEDGGIQGSDKIGDLCTGPIVAIAGTAHLLDYFPQ